MANYIVYDTARMTLSANQATPVSFIKLGKGEHRVDIEYAQGATGTVTPKQSTNPANTSALQPCTVNGTDVVATGTTSFIVAGPCCIGCIVASLSGSVQVFANRLED